MTTTEALEMNRLEILHRMELKKKEQRTEQERERQDTVAAKQRAEAKVEALEDLVEAIAARCRLTHHNSVLPLADRVQDLIENHRASQRTL